MRFRSKKTTKENCWNKCDESWQIWYNSLNYPLGETCPGLQCGQEHSKRKISAKLNLTIDSQPATHIFISPHNFFQQSCSFDSFPTGTYTTPVGTAFKTFIIAIKENEGSGRISSSDLALVQSSILLVNLPLSLIRQVETSSAEDSWSDRVRSHGSVWPPPLALLCSV